MRNVTARIVTIIYRIIHFWVLKSWGGWRFVYCHRESVVGPASAFDRLKCCRFLGALIFNRVTKPVSFFRQAWQLLPSRSSLISLPQVGSKTINQIWSSLKVSESRVSDQCSQTSSTGSCTSSTARSAARVASTAADGLVRMAVVASLLYLAFHEEIFEFDKQPPM